MASEIFGEDFSELTQGSPALPPGWTNPFGQFLCVAAPPAQTPASPNAGKFFAQFSYDTTIYASDLSLFFGFNIDLGNNSPGPLVSLQAQNSINLQPITVLQLILEGDRSISMQVGSKHIGNTADPTGKGANFVPFYATNGVWFWAQVSLQSQVNGDAVSSISYFDLDLAIEGHSQFSGSFDPSNFDAGGTSPITPGIRYVSFNSGIGFMFLRQISMWEPHFDNGTWPFPLVPPAYVHGLVSQGVMEFSALTDLIAARVSQGVIEYDNNFKFRNIRVSQGVIEVLTKRGIGAKTGWYVREV